MGTGYFFMRARRALQRSGRTQEREKVACPLFLSAGEVAEWPKARHWKCRIRETVSWVQIPPSPPFSLERFEAFSAHRRMSRCFGDIERMFPACVPSNPSLFA